MERVEEVKQMSVRMSIGGRETSDHYEKSDVILLLCG